ncbi:MAG: PEP/pyruvate-binding domain-containing protein, partial [Lachnospiraceae bacterium]
YFEVRSRMIGTGMIGGKSCGMLLARKIIEHKLPQVARHTEPHDSFFIGADVFYTFIVENGCWDLRIKQRTEEGYFEVAEEFRQAILEGHFPEDIREKFKRVLDYFGRCPIIVRSSSILEDGFGNAFAGKYDSVFCVNAGDADERLEAFEKAVKEVYASTLNPSALEYRKLRNLQERDEQMALLVQRVSGSYFEQYFMPNAAGVGYSYSMYRFMQEMDPAAGMLRIVAGLGTKAVDRTQGDYPRLISLDKPLAFARPNVADRHRYSQRKLDVLDIEKNELSEISMEDALPLFSENCKRNLLEHDTDAERQFREQGRRRDIYFISCQGLAKNEEFTKMMKDSLAVLEEAYGTPVDIEYTVNLGKEKDFVVNLLQCRPLQVCIGGEKIEIPKLPEEEKILHIEHSTMGRSRADEVQVVIKVDAYEYYSYPYAKKPSVARAIGKINQYFKNQKKNIVLIVPGRIGTSSPELGVPVAFADISGFCAIFEVAYSQVGYMPELSFGSHMFQDLVESDIFYGAVFENEKRKVYQPKLLDEMENHFLEICSEYEDLENMIQVCVLEEEPAKLYYDMESECAILVK